MASTIFIDFDNKNSITNMTIQLLLSSYCLDNIKRLEIDTHKTFQTL